MRSLKNKNITKKDLKVFTKDELIHFILHCGSIYNPIEEIYQKRLDDNFKKNEQISVEIEKLLDKTDKAQPIEKYKLLLEVQKLNKEWDKLSKENDRLMKKLYGA